MNPLIIDQLKLKYFMLIFPNQNKKIYYCYKETELNKISAIVSTLWNL